MYENYPDRCQKCIDIGMGFDGSGGYFIKHEKFYAELPLLDIKLMTDEKFNKTIENIDALIKKYL